MAIKGENKPSSFEKEEVGGGGEGFMDGGEKQ